MLSEFSINSRLSKRRFEIFRSAVLLVEQRMGNKQEKGLNTGGEKQRKRESERASPKIGGESEPSGTG